MSKEELQQIIEKWNDFLLEARKRNLSLSALLSSSAPLKVNNGVLTIGFSYEFHRDKVSESRNKAVVQDALWATFDENYDIDCVFDKSLDSIPIISERPILKQKAERVFTEVQAPQITKKKTESPIEEIFWNALSLEDFIIPQFMIGKYRVDFAIPSHRLVIELDGHNYHSSKEQRTSDAQRERWLKLNGWDVLRFTGSEIWRNVDDCVRQLRRYLGIKR